MHHPESQDSKKIESDRNEIIVALSQFEQETFVSRSQAKRVLFNLDKFDHITLDFRGVRMIGQGFSDEVFRVFQRKNPHIQIDYINANEDVEFMIKRSLMPRL